VSGGVDDPVEFGLRAGAAEREILRSA
jgi:hypothetical protein